MTVVGVSPFDVRVLPMPVEEQPGELVSVVYSGHAEELLNTLAASHNFSVRGPGQFIEIASPPSQVLKDIQALSQTIEPNCGENSTNSSIARIQWLYDQDLLSACDEKETIKQLEKLYHETPLATGPLFARVLQQFAVHGEAGPREELLAKALSVFVDSHLQLKDGLSLEDRIELFSLFWYLKEPLEALPAWATVCEGVANGSQEAFFDFLRGDFGAALLAQGPFVIRQYGKVLLKKGGLPAIQGALAGGDAGRSMLEKALSLKLIAGGLFITGGAFAFLHLAPKELASFALIGLLIGVPILALVAKRALRKRLKEPRA